MFIVCGGELLEAKINKSINITSVGLGHGEKCVMFQGWGRLEAGMGR